jgi:hypothetical protein
MDSGGSNMKAKSVDSYISGLDGWQSEVVISLRKIILAAAPDVKEAWKWSEPVYEANGPVCAMKAFKDHVTLTFWRGADIPDPQGLLEGDGAKMRHVKLSSPKDVNRKALEQMVKTGVRLNHEKGDPTKAGNR